MRTLWPAKDPEEVFVVTFDFSAALDEGEAISIAAVACLLISGSDQTPNDVLAASATISGGSVLQPVQGGVLGARYVLRCVATLGPSGRRLVLAATLPVRLA